MESIQISEPPAGLQGTRAATPNLPSPSPSFSSLPSDDCGLYRDQSSMVCRPRAGTSSSTAPSTPHDSKYYINEKMVILHVDNTLFRAHRHLLRRESDVFEHMFDSPQPAEGAEGDSDENPILIPDVTRAEFTALMDYLYEGSFFKTRSERHKTSREEFIDLLSIATRFVCIEARQKAIRGIESYSLDPIERLVLADTYDIPQWLMPSYIELCQRDNPLTPDEALWIGAEKAMSIAKAREIIRSSLETRQMPGWVSGTTWPSGVFHNLRAERIVNEAFLWDVTVRPPPPPPPPTPALPKKVDLVSAGATRKWGVKKHKKVRRHV
ncbi:hypothetical protein PM082_007963 [Marasmius tenuissimus]|nr:hypothetical protein PM082_007963 [Marasmius tenuissimus]